MNSKDVEGACRYLPAGFFYFPSQFIWDSIKKNSMYDDLVAEIILLTKPPYILFLISFKQAIKFPFYNHILSLYLAANFQIPFLKMVYRKVLPF